MLSKTDSSAIFRAGECIGFAETLPVTSTTPVPDVIQSQLDSLHQRIAKQEQKVETPTENSKEIEPQLTWDDISFKEDNDRKEAIKNERIRNLKDSKRFPQRCL